MLNPLSTRSIPLRVSLLAIAIACLPPAISRGQTDYAATSTDSSNQLFRVENLLPSSVRQNTDLNLWGWFSYLHDSAGEDATYWNGDFALGVTQRITDRLAATADVHVMNQNNSTNGFIEQAFATAELSEQAGTLLTAGKFNADFGIEPRNEWDRLTGTPGLLFGAQPQDLVGAMITQPIGSTALSLKPFVALHFQGNANCDQPPSGGVLLDYAPSDTLRVLLTNWIGPGFTPTEQDDDEYNDNSAEYDTTNWTGPEIYGTESGLLYFEDANIQWNPTPDLTLAAEGLFAATQYLDETGWSGAMVLANYDITDRWRIFGRWSYLNDNQGLITGAAEQHHELSAGVGFQVIAGLELRGEYRHDFAPSGNLDTLSGHLIFSY
jgi:hypothetical protein